MQWKRVRKWLVILAVVYLAGGAAIYFLQDVFLFRPVSLKKDHSYGFKDPYIEINIPVNEEETLNLVRFRSTATITHGVIIYFHGNRRNISWYAKYMPFFTSRGYDVIMIDYPGFGKSTGKLTEQKLYDWSEQAYLYARSEFPAEQIILYGKSMGTGIAARLAMRQQARQLILETPYYDLPSVVSQYVPIYPVRKLLHYQLPTYRFIPAIKCPIAIFHGTYDGVIRYSNAIRLKPLLKPTDQFTSIEKGSHNDLYQFEEMKSGVAGILERF